MTPLSKFLHSSSLAALFGFVSAITTAVCAAQPAANTGPGDVLVLSNGDTLHGKLVSEVGGKITFHNDSLGDVTVGWDKIKELHAAGNFAVLDKTVKLGRKKHEDNIPSGSLDVMNDAVMVRGEHAPPAPIPTKNAEYIVDAPVFDRQLNHEPSFATGWNGAATAGATLVQASQNQYTVSGAIGLVRVVPTVTWLDPRNRTSLDFSGSYGKIVQPAYTPPGGPTVPANTVKSALYHADAERDQYFSRRFYALVQTAFDHNYSQDLALQQIYGGGLGWTIFSTPRHEADLKATVQYEKEQFISGSSDTSQNLVGSTFAASYLLKMKLLTYTQNLLFIPSYNTPRAYSTSETDTVAFPAYKNLGFSLGTTDSYLNDPPASSPPTKRNSFQFTMGLTYAIKSKY